MKSQFDSDLIVFSGNNLLFWFLAEIEARLAAITTAENSNKICSRPIIERGSQSEEPIKAESKDVQPALSAGELF